MTASVRILIAADDPADTEMILRELASAGIEFEYRRVEEAGAFVAALEAFRPDLVLSDYRLNAFDGMTALGLVVEGQPDVPVIIVTASIGEETAVACIKAGATDCVLKEHGVRLGIAAHAALEGVRLRREREHAEAQRRNALEEQARQHAVLRAVLDASDASILAVDHECRYLAFNRSHAEAMRAMYGTEIEVGARMPDFVTVEEDRVSTLRRLRRALSGETVVDEGFAGREAGSCRHFTVAFSPIRAGDGAVAGAVVVGQEQTGRRRQEDRLRQLLRAVEQSPASIVITDTAGTIQYVNPHFEQVTGYTGEEAVGKNPRILKSGEMRPEVYRELWETITSGREWRGEFLNRAKTGRLFWEMASISAVRDSEGRITHFVGVKEDVTERKNAEVALKSAEKQLALVQKMEAIGRLAGGVAHDFNNLLSVILGHAEQLSKGLPGDDPRRERLDQILWSAGKAAELTRQLLAFSRRQVLETRIVRLDAVVADAQRMLTRVIGEDVDFHVAQPATLGHVRADPAQIVQVLLNLVVNARDAMPDGGRLTVEFADAELDERYAAAHPPCHPGRFVMMAVSDTGHGMDAETQKRVFEPFFTTKPEGRGTGLGLSTVYGIVKQSGGFIWAYSEVGVGSTFKVYLPRVEEAETAAEPPPTALPRSAAGGRILLVEDDESVRGLMADLLTDAGYSVLSSGRPTAAIAVASTVGSLDLLVTDVIMPDMSGRDLAHRLEAERPGLHVLYVSGYAGEALTRLGGIQRGEHFLSKPFSERGLLEAVATALAASPPAPGSCPAPR
jgi:two-component system cell cycle sensor histidine kinase/response regulator CckA